MRYDFELLQKVRAISPGLISLWIAPRISNTHYWRDLCGKYDGKFKYVDGFNNHLDGSSFFDRSGAKGRVGGHSSFAGWRDSNETRYVVASSTSGILISRGLATTTWTISAFISTSSGNNATNGKAIYAERANTGNDILKLECGNISKGVNRVGVTIRDDGGTLLQVFPSFSKELVNYRWSHVAGSMNNGTVTSYLDGKYGTGTWTGTSNFTNSNIESWIAADKGDNIAQQHLSNLDCISLHAEYLNPSQLNLLGRILSDGLTSFDREFPYYLVGESVADTTGVLAGSTTLTYSTTGTTVANGVLSGTTSLAFSTTGNAQLTGALSGTSDLSFTDTGNLLGSGVLAGPTTLDFITTGVLSSGTELAGSTTLTFTTTGDLVGVGALAASSTLTFSTTGVSVGVGVLNASTTVDFSTSGLINGIAACVANTTLDFSTTGLLGGTGTLLGNSSISFILTGDIALGLVGSTSLAFTLTGNVVGIGAISGTSSLTFGVSGGFSVDETGILMDATPNIFWFGTIV